MLAYRVFTKLSMVLHGTQSLIPLQPVCEEETDSFLFTIFFFQECSPIILSPGYILSRSKEKINVTIKTDQLFTEGPQVYVIQIKFVFIISRSLNYMYIYIYISKNTNYTSQKCCVQIHIFQQQFLSLDGFLRFNKR